MSFTTYHNTLAGAREAAITIARLTGVVGAVTRTDCGDGWKVGLPANLQVVSGRTPEWKCGHWGDRNPGGGTARQLIAKAKLTDASRFGWQERVYGGGTESDRRSRDYQDGWDVLADQYPDWSEEREARWDALKRETARYTRWERVEHIARFTSRARAAAFARDRQGRLVRSTQLKLVERRVRYGFHGWEFAPAVVETVTWEVHYWTKAVVEPTTDDAPEFLRPCQLGWGRQADAITDGVVCPPELYPEWEWA